jgi:hypothetical protein
VNVSEVLILYPVNLDTKISNLFLPLVDSELVNVYVMYPASTDTA